MAFLIATHPPTINLANAGDNCTLFSGTTLLHCPGIGSGRVSLPCKWLLLTVYRKEITKCQEEYNKTILLSVGGAVSGETGFTSESDAQKVAADLWRMFGPPVPESPNRPFDGAVVDGFDFDFEAPIANIAKFAQALRHEMDTSNPGRKFYLSAAPQCPFPDLNLDAALQSGVFDLVMVQFYNNPPCGLVAFDKGKSEQTGFNLAEWDGWARSYANRSTKVLVGMLAGPSNADKGFVGADDGVREIIEYARTLPSFGGAMIWEMSRAYGNPGFLNSVMSFLEKPAESQPPPYINASAASSVIPVSSTISLFSSSVSMLSTSKPLPTPEVSSTPGVAKTWQQCGGSGYSGPTDCEGGTSCKEFGEWWSHCEPDRPVPRYTA